MKSPQYGHPVHAERATGYGPCRLCLQTFQVGVDERLLFTYQPFTDSAALPAPGPVFIHRARCDRYDGPELPAALRTLPLVLEGYGAHGVLTVQRRVGTSSFEGVLQGVFQLAEVRYAHLRNAEAGCFIARIDRPEAVRDLLTTGASAAGLSPPPHANPLSADWRRGTPRPLRLLAIRPVGCMRGLRRARDHIAVLLAPPLAVRLTA